MQHERKKLDKEGVERDEPFDNLGSADAAPHLLKASNGSIACTDLHLIHLSLCLPSFCFSLSFSFFLSYRVSRTKDSVQNSFFFFLFSLWLLFCVCLCVCAALVCRCDLWSTRKGRKEEYTYKYTYGAGCTFEKGRSYFSKEK